MLIRIIDKKTAGHHCQTVFTLFLIIKQLQTAFSLNCHLLYFDVFELGVYKTLSIINMMLFLRHHKVNKIFLKNSVK